jgi:hypothetical protein
MAVHCAATANASAVSATAAPAAVKICTPKAQAWFGGRKKSAPELWGTTIPYAA